MGASPDLRGPFTGGRHDDGGCRFLAPSFRLTTIKVDLSVFVTTHDDGDLISDERCDTDDRRTGQPTRDTKQR
jgi:hypothetical protein